LISSGEVSIAGREHFEASLDAEGRKKLYPYDPDVLLLRRDLNELFDTTPDLTGADLDISRFIRSGDERDLQVLWLDIEDDKKARPSQDYLPRRDELCSVPFLVARDWLCGKETATKRSPRLL